MESSYNTGFKVVWIIHRYPFLRNLFLNVRLRTKIKCASKAFIKNRPMHPCAYHSQRHQLNYLQNWKRGKLEYTENVSPFLAEATRGSLKLRETKLNEQKEVFKKVLNCNCNRRWRRAFAPGASDVLYQTRVDSDNVRRTLFTLCNVVGAVPRHPGNSLPYHTNDLTRKSRSTRRWEKWTFL
jgi:hypothetical protein